MVPDVADVALLVSLQVLVLIVVVVKVVEVEVVEVEVVEFRDRCDSGAGSPQNGTN